ncbi:MAG: helix-turn-helix transcriptional regulator, partial [Microbacterium sp.]
AELGAFLRSRREQIVRADVGLGPGARGKLTGLRREEVAVASGVSMTWYTWLEQGRDISPSRQVLTAIAGALRLDATGRDYVLSLAGFAPLRPSAVTPAPEHVQRLLDAMEHPAFALAPDWGIAGWNAAYEVLYPRITSVPAAERNLIWLIFTDESLHTMLGDWQQTARSFLAEFRAETTSLLGEPAFQQLIAALNAVSTEFRDGWQRHDIAGFTSRERAFHLDDDTTVTFEHHQLRPSDRLDLQLVVYTPATQEDALLFHAHLA